MRIAAFICVFNIIVSVFTLETTKVHINFKINNLYLPSYMFRSSVASSSGKLHRSEVPVHRLQCLKQLHTSYISCLSVSNHVTLHYSLYRFQPEDVSCNFLRNVCVPSISTKHTFITRKTMMRIFTPPPPSEVSF